MEMITMVITIGIGVAALAAFWIGSLLGELKVSREEYMLLEDEREYFYLKSSKQQLIIQALKGEQ